MTTLMKSLGVAAALTLTLTTQSIFAQSSAPATNSPPPPGNSANFSAHQQKELAHIAERIQILQTLQSCVQSATNRADIKACNQTAKQSEQSLRH